MSREKEFIIDLTAAYLNGKECPPSPENIDWNEVFVFSRQHGILSIIGYAVEKYGLSAEPTVLGALKAAREQNIVKETVQELETQNLLNEFENNSIDCMPLKGYVIKNLYPMPDMRDMCDIDILIHDSDLDRIKKIMAENGFEFAGESPHEYIFMKKPYLNMELHKCLVPPYNKTLYACYGDGWKLARKQDDADHIFGLRDGDLYVYNVAHTAKHYLNSGIGIRQVLDIWIMRNRLIGSNKDYIEKQISELKLTKFHNLITELADMWFGGIKASDESVYVMEEFIINCGAMGDAAQSKISNVYRNSGDGNYMIGFLKRMKDVIIPEKKVMAYRYPILKRYAVLYPLCVIHKIFVTLFRDRKVTEEKAKLYYENRNKIEDFAEHCKTVGLVYDL